MSDAHDARHDALLERLVVGDDASLSLAERREVEGCATCREQRLELSQLERSLREYGREEHELLVEARVPRETRVPRGARDPRDAPGSEVVSAFARAKIAEARAARARGRRRIAVSWLAAAAVLALLVLGAQWWRKSATGGLDPTLGNEERVELVEPAPATGFASFEWRGKLAPEGWFEIDVRAPATDSAPARPLLAPRPRVYSGRTWTPTEEQRAAWPDEIEWRVSSCNSSGDSFARSPWQRRRRSPP